MISQVFDSLAHFLTPTETENLLVPLTWNYLPSAPRHHLLVSLDLEISGPALLPTLPNLRYLAMRTAASNVYSNLYENCLWIILVKVCLTTSGEIKLPLLPSLEELSITSPNSSVGRMHAIELASVLRSVADMDLLHVVDLDAIEVGRGQMDLLHAVADLPEIRYASVPVNGDVMSSQEWAQYRLHNLERFHGFMVCSDRVIFFTGDPLPSMLATFKSCYEGLKTAQDLLIREVNLEDNVSIWDSLSEEDQLETAPRLLIRVLVWLCSVSSSLDENDRKEQRVSDASTVESL